MANTGLACLTLMAHYLHLAADPRQIQHDHGKPGGAFDSVDILRCAKRLGLLARFHKTSVERLERVPLPAIAQMTDGSFVIFARAVEGKILIQDPQVPAPELKAADELRHKWNGKLILLTRREALAGPSRAFGLSWFLPSVVRYRRLLTEVLVASFFIQLMGLVAPLFFQVVTDKVLVHRGLSSLDVLIFGLVIVSLFEVVLGGLRSYVFGHTCSRVDVELGSALFSHLMGLPLPYFSTRPVGTIVARVRELENIRSFLTGSALTLVIDTLFAGVFIGVMFFYSTTLAWVVISTIPFYVALSLIVSPLLKRRVDLKFRHGAENQSFLVEAVGAVETCKAMAVEPQMQRKWEDLLAAYVHSSFKVQNLGSIASQCAQALSKAQTVLILWLGAKAVMEGTMTIGALVAFNMMAGRVAAPILRMAQLWQDFQQMRISVERLGDILNTPTERQNAARSALPDLKGRVTFEKVSFRYRPDRPQVLRDLSLDVAAGECIGIVGTSGSGKSTLARLIQRLFLPESGRVLIDGVDLALIDTGWLRRQIGVVLQENVLFNRSVRDNIALSNPTRPMEEVVRAAKSAAAHDFVLELPEAYDTQLVERGGNLSGGQRQRLAIARALIDNPQILIMDEATAALDYESEAIIRANLAEICRGRTVFIIAHRLSTVRHCDRIVVMDKGMIVEEGGHEELLVKGGRYSRLWLSQEAGPSAA